MPRESCLSPETVLGWDVRPAEENRMEASIDGSQSREIHKCIYDFFSLSFVSLFSFSSTFLLFFYCATVSPLPIFFSIPRLIFAVARDIRPLSDSVVPYRAIYPASMANGRHIDNGELYTLFTRVRHARAYYVSPRQCLARSLIGVAVSLLGTFT